MQTDTLILTIKRKWFIQILSGYKKEEYREIKKHWIRRLVIRDIGWPEGDYLTEDYMRGRPIIRNNFRFVEFRNGYRKDAPTAVYSLYGIKLGIGQKKWGGQPVVQVFIIHIGNEMMRSNCDKIEQDEEYKRLWQPV